MAVFGRGLIVEKIRRMVIELGRFYIFNRRKVEFYCEFAGKAQSRGWDLRSNINILYTVRYKCRLICSKTPRG